MTHEAVSLARVRARALPLLGSALLAVALTLVVACAQLRRSDGEACLKSDDCVSGVCAQLVCVEQGPLIDAEVNNPDAPPSTEGGSGTEAGTDGPTPEAAGDTGGSGEAAADGGAG